MRFRLVGAGVVMAVLIAGGVMVLVRDGGGDGEAAADVEEVRGFLFGSVEAADGNGVDAADVVVTAAGAAEPLATTTSDELGLFEVEVGDHAGPVVVQATKQAESAATVVAVSPEGATTGVQLTIGTAGQGVVDGRVLAASAAPLDEPAVVEARFVESGRSAVATLDANGAFRFEGLPFDGDLILVATTARGDQQGLAASAVSESLTTNTAEITLGVDLSAADGHQVDEPDIVTESLDDWTVDGSVRVVSADELG